jgi:hypothetical protein
MQTNKPNDYDYFADDIFTAGQPQVNPSYLCTIDASIANGYEGETIDGLGGGNIGDSTGQ